MKRSLLISLAVLLSGGSLSALTHLDIMVPERKHTDLKGPVSSVDTKISFNVSGAFERERSEYDESGNLLNQTTWNPDGKLSHTLTNFYDGDGTFNRQRYIHFEEGRTNDWDVILNPATRQIALQKESSGAAAIYTYSPDGYLTHYRYQDGDGKLKKGSITKRDKNHRWKEYTRLDDRKKPVYTYWSKWTDNGLIDRERQKYRQEKAERLQVYEYLKFDDHDNWTQRMMVRYDIGGKEKEKVYERLVVRDLEYFETDAGEPSSTNAPTGLSSTNAPTGLSSTNTPSDHSSTNTATAVVDTPADSATNPEKETPVPISDMLISGRSQDELREALTYSFDDLSDKLIIITCTSPRGKSFGSGFIAKMDGKTYIFTNQHVILGADSIRLQTPGGESLFPRQIEMSSKRDIARMLIDDRPAFNISTKFAVNSPIAVFGNSEGAGVATALYGEVAGLGLDLVEVTAEFVPGNSGSPVLNADQEAIGIASFIHIREIPSTDTDKTEDEDKKTSGDEEAEEDKPTIKTRRLCYRLNDLEWQPVAKWNDYNKRYGHLYLKSESIVNSVFSIISLWGSSLTEQIPENDDLAEDLCVWVKRHNNIIQRMHQNRFNNSKSFLITYADSLDQLAKICQDRSRRMVLFSKQRELTGFLREGFENKAQTLENAADFIRAVGRNIREQKDG